jgi:hypothetical protein
MYQIVSLLSSNKRKTNIIQIVENLKQELETNKNNLQDVQLKQSANDDDEQKEIIIINNLRSELETIRQEKDQLNEIMSELNDKLERQTSDSNENVQVCFILIIYPLLILFFY